MTTVCCALFVAACGGGPAVDRTASLASLRTAIETSVTSAEQSADHSRRMAVVADNNLLRDMTRAEVQDAIGRGDDCARHPRCSENGFEGDDWHYTIGSMGEGHSGHLPVLIVGFDRTGRVSQVFTVQTHDAD